MISLSVALLMTPGCDQPFDAEDGTGRTPFRFEGPPLLSAIAAGDASAVDRFVDRYGGLIWSIARKMSRSSHDAEDLVQEIFMEIWKKSATFQPERGSEVAFISVIARRRVIDRLRKRSSAVPVISLDDRTVHEVVGSNPDSLEISDEVAKVRHCLEQLSENTRAVLTLILQEGMSHQEVSSSMSIPMGSVKSYARRGLIFLRDCVNRPLTGPVNEAQS
jgi:RNA polymerase sigma-70 factor (ECF subfamily)